MQPTSAVKKLNVNQTIFSRQLILRTQRIPTVQIWQQVETSFHRGENSTLKKNYPLPPISRTASVFSPSESDRTPSCPAPARETTGLALVLRRPLTVPPALRRTQATPFLSIWEQPAWLPASPFLSICLGSIADGRQQLHAVDREYAAYASTLPRSRS